MDMVLRDLPNPSSQIQGKLVNFQKIPHFFFFSRSSSWVRVQRQNFESKLVLPENLSPLTNNLVHFQESDNYKFKKQDLHPRDPLHLKFGQAMKNKKKMKDMKNILNQYKVQPLQLYNLDISYGAYFEKRSYLNVKKKNLSFQVPRKKL